MSRYFSRHGGLIASDRLDIPVTIIGAGGIGSWTSLSLVKLGFTNLTIVDFDHIEEENLSSQFYTRNQIGELKVEALKKNLLEHNKKASITIYPLEFQKIPSKAFSPIVICALDSLAIRKELWSKIKTLTKVSLYLDSRMGGETMRMYSIPLTDYDAIEKYHLKLSSSRPAEDIPCSEKAIVYNTQVNGGIVASLLKKYIMKEDVPFELNFLLDGYISIVNYLEKNAEDSNISSSP